MLLIAIVPSSLYPLRVTLHSTRQSVGILEEFKVRVTVSGGSDQRGSFKLITGNNFRVVSESSSWNFSFSSSTGGASVSRRQFITHYGLIGTRIGRYKIGPCLYTSGGKRYRSNTAYVRVIRGASSGRTRRRRRRFRFGFSDIFPDQADEPVKVTVEIAAAVPRPFVSQELILYLDVYASRSAVFQVRPVLPAFPGFWVEQLKLPHSDEPVKVKRNGKTWHRYRYRVARLYPTRPGRLRIATVTGIIRTRGFLSMGSRFKTEARTVHVRPIPAAGKPEGFFGVVGTYALKADPVSGNVFSKEPFRFTVRVQGRGLLQSITSLEKVVPGGLYRILSPQIETAPASGRGESPREKSFIYTIYPQKAGELPLPVFRLVYFDPVASRYKSIATEKGTLTVEKGQENGPSPGKPEIGSSRPLVYFRGVDFSDRFLQPFPAGVYGIVFGSLVLITLFNVILVRRRDALLTDPEKLKRLNAYSRARSLCNAAALQYKKGDRDRALGSLEKALKGFVADKLGRSGMYVSYGVLEEEMHGAGLKPETVAAYLAVCQECGRLRYGSGSESGVVDVLLQQAKKILLHLKKEWS